jgi:hypothetical protein
MGRITTPTYRVEYRTKFLALGKIASDCASNVDGKRVCIMAWRGKQDGRATEANLLGWAKGYNESFAPGGSNAHLAIGGEHDGITWARLFTSPLDARCQSSAVPG